MDAGNDLLLLCLEDTCDEFLSVKRLSGPGDVAEDRLVARLDIDITLCDRDLGGESSGWIKFRVLKVRIEEEDGDKGGKPGTAS